jgi:hypothetical protein
MQRETARNIIVAGAVLLLAWLVAVVLRFLVEIAFFAGLALVIIGTLLYLVNPRR